MDSTNVPHCAEALYASRVLGRGWRQCHPCKRYQYLPRHSAER
jgi:hypothetical protein